MISQPNESKHFIDQLDFSDMTKLKAIVFDTPEAELAKIQLIKEELSTGRYKINSTQIADKLLEFALVAEEMEMV